MGEVLAVALSVGNGLYWVLGLIALVLLIKALLKYLNG